MALTNRTLIIFKYLWETTDEAHPVSLADISAHLEEHGITADPRTLRKDIEQLTEFGVDVKDRRVQNLYHVATRHFEARRLSSSSTRCNLRGSSRREKARIWSNG